MADLSTLTTWAESVGPHHLYDRKKIRNEGQRHSYTLNRQRQLADTQVYRHGNRLQSRSQFDPQTQFVNIDPLNTEAQYNRVNPGKFRSAPFSLAYASIVFNRFAEELSAAQANPEKQADIFYDYWTQCWVDFHTGVANQIDNDCWRVPDKTIMEVTTTFAGAPASYPVFMNEFANGLPAAANQPGGPWTTIEQLAPTDAATVVDGRSRWDCQRFGYDLSALTDAAVAKHKFSMFFQNLMNLYTLCKFDKLPKHPEFSSPTMNPRVIFCSLWGKALVQHGLTVSEDHFRGMGVSQDPAYPSPLFYGMPFEYIDLLDRIAVYPTGATDNLGTEASLANVTHGLTSLDSLGVSRTLGYAGPRYYMPDHDNLFYTWQADNMLTDEGGWMRDIKTPWEQSKVFTGQRQLWCERRSTQGILFPTADAQVLS